MKHLRRHTKRVLIGILGGVVVLLGLVLIPYPGPGWLIVFAGLGILATEFDIAARLLARLKDWYEYWKAWLKRQHFLVQLLSLALTGLVVLTTVWLVNGFGLVNDFFQLGFDWIRSPFLW